VKESANADASKQIEFLYKFKPGVAGVSLGILVAEKAGLNTIVLKNAARKAAQFNDKLALLVQQV
jgi:DNA mismatch repair ATPase MutS